MRDDVVLPHEVDSDPVGVVEPLAADFAVQPGNIVHGPLVVGGALVAAHTRETGQGLLRCFELRSGLAAVAGIGDVLTVGGGEE